MDESRVTAAVWGPFDQFLITGHEDGTLAHYNITEVSPCLYPPPPPPPSPSLPASSFYLHLLLSFPLFLPPLSSPPSLPSQIHNLILLTPIVNTPVITQSLCDHLFQSDKRLHSVREHKGLIADLQASHDQSMIITACKDFSAKVRIDLAWVM